MRRRTFLSLPAALPLAAPGQTVRQRAAAFGDSTTAPRKGLTVFTQLDLPGWEWINAGAGGNNTNQARERFERDVLAHKPDVAVLQFGINDAAVDVWKTPPADGPRVPLLRYRENVTFFVRELRKRGIEPLLMTPNPLRWTERLRSTYGKVPYDPGAPDGFNLLLRQYAEAVRQVARAESTALLDVYRVFERMGPDPLLLDGMHPNNAGHKLVARLLRGQLLRGGPRPRAYTLPSLDLASDVRRQVIVDREPGQYLGHPTTVLLDDNRTMLCVYPKGHGRGGIVYKRSTDAGLTWSERLPVPDNWSTSQEVPTLFRTGQQRLIMFSGLYPIRMAVSEDEGATWTPLKPIGDFGGIVAMGDMTRLRDGRFMALFHDDGRFLRNAMTTGPFRVFKTISSDGGLTWSQPQAILDHPAADLCEPGLVRSPDGRQLAVLLRENARLLNSLVSFSDDEGNTWTEPVELPGALTGDRHTARYDTDGRLVVVFRDTAHESPTRGDFVAWVGRYDDLRTGAEGQYRVRLLDNTMGADCGYPGLERLPDGTFVATTYGHWIQGEPPFVMSARFRLAELDSMATSQSRGHAG